MGSFNKTYSKFTVTASVSTYCKNTNGVIDHVGTSRSPGSVTKTFSTSDIPSNAIIDSVNFSINKVVSGNTVGNSIEYIAEVGTDTIRANNETILNWLNNNRGNDNKYPDITINCWANTTGYPNHTHSNTINTSKLITDEYKVTYNEISLAVSYHLDMDLDKTTPNIEFFYISDIFKGTDYSTMCYIETIPGGINELNSTSIDLNYLSNCIFQGYSTLHFGASAESYQSADESISYNLIIKKEDGSIIYNEVQEQGLFFLPSNIFSSLTVTRAINGTNFKAEKITFYYKVKDATNRETQATGDFFLISGYFSPKINNFTVSKDGTYAKGDFDATFSEIPYHCSETNGIISASKKNYLNYQKILKNNDTDESSSSNNYPYTKSITNSYFVEDSGEKKISLDDDTDYTLTIKVTDICNSATSSFNLKPETVFLDIETTGVSIGRQILNERESYPKFEVHLPTHFYNSSKDAPTFSNGIYVTGDSSATNLVDCESEFWGNVRISNGKGKNNQFYVEVPSTFKSSTIFNNETTFNNKAIFKGGVDFGESVSFDFSKPITFGDNVTFEGDLIFSGSSNLDFSQPIMATGGIIVGDTNAEIPSGATFNGAATFKKGVTFEDAVTFNDLIIFNSSPIFPQEIFAAGGITVGATDVSNPSGATFNGAATFNNSAIFNNSVIFNSSLQFNSASFSSASINSGGSLSVYGNSTFSKNISANGGITVGSSAVATFNGSAVFNNEATFNKKVTFKGGVDLGESASFDFSQPIMATGGITVGTELHIVKDSEFTCDTEAYFTAMVQASGGMNVSGSFTSYSTFLSGVKKFICNTNIYGKEPPTTGYENPGQLFFKIID